MNNLQHMAEVVTREQFNVSLWIASVDGCTEWSGTPAPDDVAIAVELLRDREMGPAELADHLRFIAPAVWWLAYMRRVGVRVVADVQRRTIYYDAWDEFPPEMRDELGEHSEGILAAFAGRRDETTAVITSTRGGGRWRLSPTFRPGDDANGGLGAVA